MLTSISKIAEKVKLNNGSEVILIFHNNSSFPQICENFFATKNMKTEISLMISNLFITTRKTQQKDGNMNDNI